MPVPITMGSSNCGLGANWTSRPSELCSTSYAVHTAGPTSLTSSKIPQQHRLHCQASSPRTRMAGNDTLSELLGLLRHMDMAPLHAAFCSFLLQADLTSFVRVVCKLHKAGLPTAKYVGPAATGVLAKKLQDLCNQDLDSCLCILSTLSQCGFAVRKLVPPLLVMQSCAKTGDVKRMLRYTSLVPRNVRLFNDVISGLAQQGDLEAAKLVLSFLPAAGYTPDMYIYRTLVDACAVCGQPAAATTLFQDMVEAGLTPNVFVCNSVLNANVKDLNVVRRIHRQMQDLGVKPDGPTYHILLKAFCTAGRHDLVSDLYREVQGCVAQGSLHVGNLTYSRFIQAFGDAKMWESAIRVKDGMVDAGVVPNAVTWNCLIGAFATCGLGGQALHTLRDMIMSGCDPNADSYNTVLHAFVEGGQQEKACQLFEEWKRDGLFSSILREELGTSDLSSSSGTTQHDGEDHQIAHVHQASLDSLRRWLQGARNCQPDLVTYNTMMKACRKAPHDAQLLMQEMRRVGFHPDQKSWSTLLDTYGAVGDLDAATKVFWDMEQAGIPHDAVSYTCVIKACVVARNPDTAFHFFGMMKAAGIRPNIVTYNTLLRAQRKCGQLSEVQRALALYEEMRDAGFAPKDRILKGLLEEWAEGALRRRNSAKRAPGSGQDATPSSETGGLDEYTELLLQKVGAHANTDQGGNTMAIDLRGLSKAEARLAVLAVLRILKEKHSAEDSPVTQDLEMITGAGRQTRSVIQDAILAVLQDELGLTVLFVDNQNSEIPQPEVRRLEGDTAWSSPSKVSPITHSLAEDNLEPVRRQTSSDDSGQQVNNSLKIVARRPFNSGRLKVSKETLNAWLRKVKR